MLQFTVLYMCGINKCYVMLCLLYCAFFKLFRAAINPLFGKRRYCPNNAHEDNKPYQLRMHHATLTHLSLSIYLSLFISLSLSLHSPFSPTNFFISHCSKIFGRAPNVTTGAILFTRFCRPLPADQSRPSHPSYHRTEMIIIFHMQRLSVLKNPFPFLQ